MNIHNENYDVLVRTPMVCQNGHHRWLYHLISQGEARTLWGPRECECPTGEIDEGFTASGPSEAVLEEVDKRIARKDENLKDIKKFVEGILNLDDDEMITHIVIALERIVEYLGGERG